MHRRAQIHWHSRRGKLRRCRGSQSFHPRSFHPRSFHPRSFHPRSFHPRSFHLRSFHPRSFHLRSFHLCSFHLRSFHLRSFHPRSSHLSPRHLSLHCLRRPLPHDRERQSRRGCSRLPFPALGLRSTVPRRSCRPRDFLRHR